MKKGLESIGKFVVSGGDATERLESIEEALDQMTSLVAMPIDRTFVRPIATGRNVGVSPSRLDEFDQFVAVIAFVGGNRGGLDTGNQGRPLGHIGNLSSGHDQAKGIAQRKSRLIHFSAF